MVNSLNKVPELQCFTLTQSLHLGLFFIRMYIEAIKLKELSNSDQVYSVWGVENPLTFLSIVVLNKTVIIGDSSGVEGELLCSLKEIK